MKIKCYLRIDKGYAVDLCRDHGIDNDTLEGDEQIGKLIGALYEVPFVVDLDTGEIVSCNGKDVRNAPDYEEEK
jgi:hypothetical protein